MPRFLTLIIAAVLADHDLVLLVMSTVAASTRVSTVLSAAAEHPGQERVGPDGMNAVPSIVAGAVS